MRILGKPDVLSGPYFLGMALLDGASGKGSWGDVLTDAASPTP